MPRRSLQSGKCGQIKEYIRYIKCDLVFLDFSFHNLRKVLLG